MTLALIRALHLPAGTKGALVAQVAPNSPAAAAGLQQGDVILQVAGSPTSDPAAAVAIVRRNPIGRPLSLLVLRNGHTHYVTVTPEQMPSNAS